MQLNKALLLSLTLLIALPVLAAASDVAPEKVTVETPALEGCGVEATSPVGSETDDLADQLLTPEADDAQQDCCEIARRQCEANCRQTGVFEFSCDPSTCSSSCICNIG